MVQNDGGGGMQIAGEAVLTRVKVIDNLALIGGGLFLGTGWHDITIAGAYFANNQAYAV